MPASIRAFHTSAANQELQHNLVKLHTLKYGEVEFIDPVFQA